MKISKIALATAAAALAVAPAAAQAANADRASAPATKSTKMGGAPIGAIIAALAVVIGAVVIATTGDDEPTSP
ncbi:hypothetical protein D6858_00820 [Tsuneonella suprasediminis]|uniref:Ferrochelatase n=1 Tax=Tsuneonella suprasediminis TaxID=2306996 RepID=A0A419R5N9_9SPHN|nr:hypothetical protein [Tsuneonella suprasediminis]RJX71212.1 hypothetical protein D6858_00820 [Tsuneonella suprasediminis]